MNDKKPTVLVSIEKGILEVDLREHEKQAVQKFIDDLEEYFYECGHKNIDIEGLRRCFKIDFPSEE